ncbi:hypothetical protein DSM112329_02865 [Paraconexibacter sp. AEG42_29]|uniref:Uncharacterized protein n=1 Tax=Paraconexibacter sp. AEG42_29 TaxID=2997339 RepID=A0AAU7AWC7_9ACTN
MRFCAAASFGARAESVTATVVVVCLVAAGTELVVLVAGTTAVRLGVVVAIAVTALVLIAAALPGADAPSSSVPQPAMPAPAATPVTKATRTVRRALLPG